VSSAAPTEPPTAPPATRSAPRGRRAAFAFLTTLAVLAALFFGAGGWYFSDQIRSDGLAISRDGDAKPSPATPGDLVGRAGAVRFSDVAYPCGASGAGTAIGDCPAWFVPREDGSPGDGTTWAVLLHGRGATRAEPLHGLAGAVRAGMPALDITYRNDEGAPEDPGHFYRYGETEWRDLAAAVDYAREHGARNVVLFGYSMGGSIVASYLRHGSPAIPVRGVVLDAPMLDFGRTVDFGASHRSLPLVGLPIPGALVGTAKAIAGHRFGVHWGALDYVDGDWLHVPALLFQGSADRTVPPATSKEFAALHRDLVRLVLTSGTHVGSWKADAAGYDRALDDYLAALR
jgi:pimeloyl-ACP methyl ester carboxylesterase